MREFICVQHSRKLSNSLGFLSESSTVVNMAVGKSQKVSKKGAKKKAVDSFLRKEWYDVKAPMNFANRDIGKTIVNRTQGTRKSFEIFNHFPGKNHFFNVRQISILSKRLNQQPNYLLMI